MAPGFIDILRASNGHGVRSLTPISTVAAPADGLIEAITGAPPGRVTIEQALGNSDAYACIRVLADAVASIPLVVYRRSPVGRERVTTGVTANLLRHPSPTMTSGVLFATVMAHLQGWGNAYVAKYRARGQVTQLGVIHPARVTVRVDAAGEPTYLVPGPAGGQVECNRRDICHIKGMTLDGIIGVSPVAQARGAFQVAQGLETVAATLMANGARLSGVLKHPMNLSQTAADRLKGAFRRLTTGVEAGGVIVLAEGMEYQAISLSPEDAQLIEQRKLSATQIARVFRVPPYMIGAETGSSLTYSNVEQETASFLTHSVRPWLAYIEQALAADEDLFPRGGDTYPEFLIDAFLRSDARTRADIYAIALDPAKGWMRRDEVRARENLDAEPVQDPTTSAKEAVA